ncbi:MAG: PEP-CTERM sorting domain-containing protein [Anaerohalosphaeraceae bacterium]
MNTQIKNYISFLALVMLLALSWTPARADDLNPPPYRGGPLSVYAHWNLLPGTTFLNLTGFSTVDDNDPTTVLHPVQPSPQVPQGPGGSYEFQLPNFVDQMPIKYMRVQLAWLNSSIPPISVSSLALDGTNPITGQVTYISPVMPDASGVGAYQYYDLIFKPNPDFERVQIAFTPNAVLSQVVIDTISTVPEPATLGLLGIGALGLLRRRRA